MGAIAAVAPRASRISRWEIAFGATAVAGLVLRVWIQRSALGIGNSDEAVVGLMTRATQHGDLPVFFWGQSFGGAQESYFAVPLFWIFGSSWIALRVVPIAFHALAALLVWRVGLRTVGMPAAAIAGALFWIWPPFLVFQLSRAQSCYYASGVAYVALVVLLGLRMVELPSARRVGLFGLVFGLAFWQTAQIIPITVGVVAWALWRQPRILRKLWVAVPLAIAGAIPWLLFNLRHDWASLTLPKGDGTYIHRLRLFFSPLLPMVLSLRRPFTQDLLLPHLLTDLILLTLFVLFVAGAFRARRRATAVLYVVAASYPFLYAFNPLATESTDPRYLLLLTPVMALLLAQLATRYAAAVAMLALALVLTWVTLDRIARDSQHALRANPVPPRNIAPLVATLDRLHIDRVYADYWIAYVITFDTRERILAVHNKLYPGTFRNGQVTPALDPYPRNRGWEREVAAARHGFVIYRQQLHRYKIVPQLERHGYRQYRVQNFVVFAPPRAA